MTLQKTKSKRKPKTKSIARLLDDAAVLLQKIRRIQAADDNGYCVCVSCGKSYHWKEMEGGHWIPRTKTATKIERRNINPQCHSCNHYRKLEAAPIYSQYMYQTYGDVVVDELIALSKTSIKRSRPELLAIIEGFKQELAEL